MSEQASHPHRDEHHTVDCEIIAIGTELTLGMTVNTNAAWLSRELLPIGVRTRAHLSVPDDLGQMMRAITDAIARTPLVIVTGGLGPTADDYTREAVQAAMGVTWQTDVEEREAFRKRWEQRTGRELPATSLGQFELPVGANKLRNRTGVALGFLLPHTRCTGGTGGWLAVLPGVPTEAMTMAREELMPLLRERIPASDAVGLRELLCCGMIEARIDELCRDLLEPGRDPAGSITLQEASGAIALRFTTRGGDATKRLDEVEAEVRRRLGRAVYSVSGTSGPSGTAGPSGGGETVADALVRLLAKHSLTVGLAESCTGGLATHFVSRVPGVSEWLMQSVVSYSDRAKIERLGVPAAMISEHGAVSEDVARAMAEGICATGHVDLGIGITGIAGPGGGSDAKPVGLVWFGISLRGRTVAHKRIIPGDRQVVQQRAAWHSLVLAREHLLDVLEPGE